MRSFVSSVFLIAALLPSAAAPQSAPAREPLAAASLASLDSLFESLKRERDPQKARGIARTILARISDSGSATVNLLMQWAASAANQNRNAAALDFLDRASLLEPAAAEIWNRRAALHQAAGDSRKAMADLAEALKREPRHFGAIAAMATILAETGSDQAALAAWETYLSLYPADREAQDSVSKLSEKIAGSRT